MSAPIVHLWRVPTRSIFSVLSRFCFISTSQMIFKRTNSQVGSHSLKTNKVGQLLNKKTLFCGSVAGLFSLLCILPQMGVVLADEKDSSGKEAFAVGEENITSEKVVAEDVVILDEAEGQLKVGLAKEKPGWDPKGYIMFCPCMGRFGNQAEHYVGTLAFAKALDRTLVLAPFRTYLNVPFSEWFLEEPLKEYHRVITMEDFLEYLAPEHWPEGKRRGYCSLSLTSDVQCDMKNGNPFGPFWEGFNIDFDETTKFELPIYAQDGNAAQNDPIKAAWDNRFPVEEHPVLALRRAPAPFPIMDVNRQIQQYFHWAPGIFAEAKGFMEEMFKGEKYVAIHLRTGIDWERACANVNGIRRFMASPQCHEVGVEAVNKEMCYPSVKHVLEHTRNAIEMIGAKHLFIATDKYSYKDQFEKDLKTLKVSVHHLDPHLPQLDLIIMGEADFFIGNCGSSFTSFVKRFRDARDRPSTFWNRELDDPLKGIGEIVEYKRQ